MVSVKNCQLRSDRIGQETGVHKIVLELYAWVWISELNRIKARETVYLSRLSLNNLYQWVNSLENEYIIGDDNCIDKFFFYVDCWRKVFFRLKKNFLDFFWY